MSESKISIDESSFFQEESNLLDYNDSSDGLEIDISDSPKRKDKINIEDKHVLENIEEEIERQYDEKAAKSNLSAVNVKNILRHVITNEHVWAMVCNTEDGNVNADTIYEPKFTRSKTKELLQTRKLAASIPWMKPKSTSEVHEILINEELTEDSDDDEYIPLEEESETETCNTSEIDSQPPTPVTPSSTHDNSTQTIWTEDGIFKVPSSKTPVLEDIVNDATIALRTRSKFSLSDTPLEVIEEALIPPDITTDMYDLECDDEDWSDFLKKFTRPLDEAVQGTLEDDDEADPEYNVLADEEIDKLDKEELRVDRAVKISKRELNNLVSELFEFSEMFTNTKEFESVIGTTIPADINDLQNNPINNQSINETVEHQPQIISTSLPEFETIVLQPEIPESILPDQMLLFEQQMRQHVQMLTQNFVLTYQHTEVGDLAENFKNMVLSLYELSKYKTSTAFQPCNLNLAVQFINDWQNLVDSNCSEVVEMKKQMENTYNQYYRLRMQHRQQKVLKFPKLVLQKISQSPVFMYPSLLPSNPFRWQNIISDRKRMPQCSQSEDELIAIGLEQFYHDLEKDEKYIKKWGRPRIADLAYYIAKYIIPVANQRKLAGRIKQLKQNRAMANPIKYFFQTKQAPRTVHYVENVLKLGMLPPLLRPAALLPAQWKSFIYPEQVESLKRVRKVQKPPPFNKGQPTKKQRLLIPNDANNLIDPVLLVFNNNLDQSTSNIVKTKRLKNRSISAKSTKKKPENYINNISKNKDPTFKELHCEQIKLIPENLNASENSFSEAINTIPCPIIKEDFSNDSFVTKEDLNAITSSNNSEKQSTLIDLDVEELIPENIISKSENKRVSIKLNKTKKVSSLSNGPFFRNSTFKISPKLLNIKFNSSIFSKQNALNMLPSMPFLLTPQKEALQNDLELSSELSDDKSPSIEKPSINDAKQSLSEPVENIKIYDEKPMSPLNENNQKLSASCEKQMSPPIENNKKLSTDEKQMLSSNEINSKLSTDDEIIEIENDTHKKDDEDELNALMVASTTLQQKNKRIQTTLTKRAKQMKQYNATLAMLCPEDTNHVEEKAKNYAQAYYDKVQERLECESPVEYQRFMEALSEHDESSSTVSDLYEKVSSVLNPKHPDLCEEFLTFLTAEQAQLIGKLVPHFMLSNMSLFLRKLEIYYSNQPAQLRRIYNCLTELAEMKDVTMDKIRSTILPLLKGNTLLINWFLQLFPKEAPPESAMTDWEEINCDDSEEMDDNDKLYEKLTLPEVEDPYGGPNCICKCHKIDDEMYRSRNRHCIPCGTKFLQGRVYIQTGKGLRLANVKFNSSNADHSKRLSIKPFIRQKRKSETSPNKGFMSPTKDDEPRHSNESEDDINADNISSRKSKTFRANSPSKSRKRITNKSTPKARKDCIKSRIKTDIPTSPNCNKKSKPKIKNTEENSNESHEKLFVNSPCKEDPTKHEATESETEVFDWDVKTSPGPSIESVDTCEESSQDTIPAQGSESDDSIEVESVNSDNSDDSNDDALTEHENTHSWTRDEDKVILQTFQQSGEEQKAFKEIQQRLPDRTILEIRQRFHVLMSLLQEMAAK